MSIVDTNDSQPEKAPSPMAVIPMGRLMSVIALQFANALAWISVMVDGSPMLVMDSHPLNKPIVTLVMPVGMVIFPMNRYVVQNPPALPLSQQAFDELYSYPYTFSAHPDYDKAGGVPALAEVQFSLTSNRGCYGACSFCAITSHQGRIIQTRSIPSLVAEAKRMTEHPDFKGYIHDVGGPTANFQGRACDKQETYGPCAERECLWPKPWPT